jgi:hypothetical protein
MGRISFLWVVSEVMNPRYGVPVMDRPYLVGKQQSPDRILGGTGMIK